jgi:hypothetical protein
MTRQGGASQEVTGREWCGAQTSDATRHTADGLGWRDHVCAVLDVTL